MFILIFLALITITLLQGDPSSPVTIGMVLSALMPLVVYGATWLVGRINVNIPAWAIVAIVVPALSILATWLVSLVGDGTGSGMAWWQQFIYNLAAVFTHEILKKLPTSTTTPVKPGQ